MHALSVPWGTSSAAVSEVTQFLPLTVDLVFVCKEDCIIIAVKEPEMRR
jgi:hypothetical protein